jgi:hypothetical protein
MRRWGSLMGRVKAEDRIGQVFGKLKIMGVSKSGRRVYADCECSCGVSKSIRLDGILQGSVLSCGCYNKEVVSKTHTKHGMSHSRTYSSWESMKARCNNPKSTKYEIYGGRGITFQESWKEYVNFLNDMGEAPDGCTLDRIEVNGDYTKSNCRWASASIQTKNTRKSKGSFVSDYKGVRFDKRAKTGGWLFGVMRDGVTLRMYCSSEIEAAACFDFCTKIIYPLHVELNNVSYELEDSLKVKLLKRIESKFNTTP